MADRNAVAPVKARRTVSTVKYPFRGTIRPSQPYPFCSLVHSGLDGSLHIEAIWCEIPESNPGTADDFLPVSLLFQENPSGPRFTVAVLTPEQRRRCVLKTNLRFRVSQNPRFTFSESAFDLSLVLVGTLTAQMYDKPSFRAIRRDDDSSSEDFPDFSLARSSTSGESESESGFDEAPVRKRRR